MVIFSTLIRKESNIQKLFIHFRYFIVNERILANPVHILYTKGLPVKNEGQQKSSGFLLVLLWLSLLLLSSSEHGFLEVSQLTLSIFMHNFEMVKIVKYNYVSISLFLFLSMLGVIIFMSMILLITDGFITI